MKFFEPWSKLHPDAPRPFAIGNCQAGYQTLMVAMLGPDLFRAMAGSRLSPMSCCRVCTATTRCASGGLLGGVRAPPR